MQSHSDVLFSTKLSNEPPAGTNLFRPSNRKTKVFKKRPCGPGTLLSTAIAGVMLLATPPTTNARAADIAALDSPVAIKVRADTCKDGPANVATTPLRAGRMEVSISAPCHPNATISLQYASYAFHSKLDATGAGRILLDAFQPQTTTVTLNLPDNETRAIDVETFDADRITKVALLWKVPVNLDIHALEYAARRGEAGHVWAKAPSTAETAIAKTERTRRGRGFLTRLDTSDDPTSTRAEIYTLIQPENAQSGTIGLSVDFETRAATDNKQVCSDGRYAEVAFEVIVSRQGKLTNRERGLIPSRPCGAVTSERSRYLTDALPDLRLR